MACGTEPRRGNPDTRKSHRLNDRVQNESARAQRDGDANVRAAHLGAPFENVHAVLVEFERGRGDPRGGGRGHVVGDLLADHGVTS